MTCYLVVSKNNHRGLCFFGFLHKGGVERKARQDMISQDKARQNKIRQEMRRQDKTHKDKTILEKTSHDTTRQGKAKKDSTRNDKMIMYTEAETTAFRADNSSQT